MFEFCREEEDGRKLGNGKRGCVAYIYTLSNDPTPFPAIPPGVGGSKESPSVLAYISTSQGSYSSARAAPAAQQPLHLYPNCPRLEYTNCNYHRNVLTFPIAPTISKHFRENERNKNTILWRSLFPGLLAPWIIPTKLDIDLRRARRAYVPIGVADTVADVLL